MNKKKQIMHKKRDKSCIKKEINNDALLKHIKLNLLISYNKHLTLNELSKKSFKRLQHLIKTYHHFFNFRI